ncbi:MAG TPA: peroxiredoxin, partial [Thermoanaerobaculia bacterium]
MVQVGDAVPEFALANQDGKTVRAGDLRGRKVVIFAFPKADTPGCTQQACGFRDETPRLEAAGAVVLGLSPDPPAKLRKWKDKVDLPYDLLSDPGHELLEALGAWGERSMYGKKYMGVVRSHWILDEQGRFADVRIKVSPQESVEAAT